MLIDIMHPIPLQSIVKNDDTYFQQTIHSIVLPYTRTPIIIVFKMS